MPDEEMAGAGEPREADDGTARRADDTTTFEPPIEPGSPSLENALFVLLGVAVGLTVVLRLVQLFG